MKKTELQRHEFSFRPDTSYQIGNLGLNKDNVDNSNVPNSLISYSLGYRLQFISFGLNLAYDRVERTENASGYTTDTNIDRYKLGGSYKIHPLSSRCSEM